MQNLWANVSGSVKIVALYKLSEAYINVLVFDDACLTIDMLEYIL